MSNKEAEALLPSDFYDRSAIERTQTLKELADRVNHNQTVVRQLSFEEKQDLKENLSELSIKLKKVEAEKKDVLAGFREEIKGLRKNIDPILESLDTGFEQVEDDVYFIFDHDSEKAFGFTPNGQCVEERRLRPDERQRTLKPININRASNGDQ